MKTSSLFMIFSLLLVFSISAEILEKVETIPEQGIQKKYEESLQTEFIDHQISRPENLWQTADPAAICGEVQVSTDLQNSFVRWQTNTERVSLFDLEGNNLWEHPVGNLDFDYPIDMTEDGSKMAIGDAALLKILEPESSDPVWTLQFAYSIKGIQLTSDGQEVFVSHLNEAQGLSYLQKYAVGDDSPVWEAAFPGGCGTLTISGDDSTLIFTQYGGGHDNMFVMAADSGDLIFQTDEYNQNPPALSYDASLIVNGDYSGYVWVYEFNQEMESYQELWHYHVNGGGTSDWIGGMAVSEDGSTIAVGTLTFITGGYNGQIYLFNSHSPTPVWIYEDAGDYVIDVDLTADGSLLAVASYGPYGGVGSEFMLFRRQSNIPVFEIDSPGSLFSVDIAADGSFCTTGGKAVHAREMGSGGYVYCLDSDLGGGHIAGMVNLEGSEDNSGVRIEAPDLVDYYTFSDFEGSYFLNNLPEGLHTLEFSKTGYETVTCFDGIVIEGETTELETVTLIASGEPPVNLTASQAAGTNIELTWQPAPGTEPTGYYVYRKRYEPDPFPEEPLAIVLLEDSYSDDTALPRLEYYYAVTAITDTGEQTPFSNQAIGWTSSGFMVDELSVYAGTAPVIDGNIEAAEWEDAYSFDASDFWGSYDSTPQPVGSVTGYLKMDEEQNWLYGAFINYNDPILEDHDEVALYIDDNGDGTYPPVDVVTEGNYWAVYYAAGNELRFRPIYETGSVGDVVYLEDPQVEASDAEGYVTFEFAIPFGDEDWEINPGVDNNSTIGIFVLDDNTPDPHGFDSWWPHDNLNIFDPAGYGVIQYAAEIQTPQPPANLNLTALEDHVFQLDWDMPQMNDFSHFNIYFALNDEQFEMIDTSQGTCWLYEYEFFPQTSYSFYLTTVNNSGSESDASQIVEYLTTDEVPDEIPLVTRLIGNYPNPFNPDTTIRFSIAENNSRTVINLYNIKGQMVKTLVDEVLPAGYHQITWNGCTNSGKQTASGFYLLQMQSGSFSCVKKLILLK